MGHLENRVTEADLVEFVSLCRDHYHFCGIEPTEAAHSPLPKCLGGTKIVLLTREDHARHDVLQTECYGEGTLTPFYYKELIGTAWEQRAKDALSVRQSQSGKVGGQSCLENRRGRNNPEAIMRGVETQRRENKGMFDPDFHSFENKSSAGKVGSKTTNSQKWMCTVSKRVSTAGPLTIIQKSLGIDPSNRVRVS